MSWYAAAVQAASGPPVAMTRMTNWPPVGVSRSELLSVANVTTVGLLATDPAQVLPGALATEVPTTVNPAGKEAVTQTMFRPFGSTVRVTLVGTPALSVMGEAVIDQGMAAFVGEADAIASANPSRANAAAADAGRRGAIRRPGAPGR